MARREKKPVHKVVMTEGKRNIIQQLLQEYDIETAEDIQDALKDLLGGTIKEMMEAEMDDYLGYQKSERSDSDDYRNGYKSKRVNSSYGSMDIDVPQDRKSTFEPQIVKKRQKDISDIDQKIISMYAKGMTTRQISETIEDIYGFETSEGFISDVTDKILPQIEDWQNRPLDEVYPILYIDAIAPIQFPHSIKLPVVIIEQMLLIQYLKEVSCVWLPDAQVILEEVVVLCTHLFPLPDGLPHNVKTDRMLLIRIHHNYYVFLSTTLTD